MVTLLDYNWKFFKGEAKEAYKEDFDDSAWRRVRVPHDYAIEGPFDIENDRQVVEIKADKVKKSTQEGRTGGLPINDPAWYRRAFTISKDAKNVFLEFDGVMCNATVFVNGVECYHRPYGYSSFSVDITDKVRRGEANLLAVSTDPEPCASRWYPGAGIYRNVRLVERAGIYIPYSGVCITTDVKGKEADIHATIELAGESTCSLVASVYRNDQVVAEKELKDVSKTLSVDLHLNKFDAWDIESPALYRLYIKLVEKGKIIDSYDYTFGIRTIEFDHVKGFLLNGIKREIKGVCMHHDLGMLGTAVNKYAIRRQIEILLSFGVNAIRTSHNPPTPELLELCDEMGLVVMDEAFDEWRETKVINGYAKHFDEWHERDLTDLIRRDRNHPCVIMWSIGNEIHEQWNKGGVEYAKMLAKICRKEDPTRSITTGYNAPHAAIKNGLADCIDIVGVNYCIGAYKKLDKLSGDKIMLGSETSSCVSSRGEYNLPIEYKFLDKEYENKLIPSYDLAGPGWACTPDSEFAALAKNPNYIGEFVWTGFDYLGEPTPYYCKWPCRSSYFGIVDLAGLPKDRYYSYQSVWTDKDVMHILPHWNWEVGDKVDVHCYSNYDEVELFLNGKSLGIAQKGKFALNKLSREVYAHRLVWKGVKFEAGELKAVAIKNPKVFDRKVTASLPYALKLSPEKTTLKADGYDLAYIRCDIVDKNGNICPTASNKLEFSVNGVGEYLASDNGDQRGTRTFSEPYCEAFNGSAVVCCRSIDGKSGNITVKVSSDGIGEAAVTIKTR